MENSVIDQYLSKIDKLERLELEKIRMLAKSLVPDAVEVISYGIPGFKYLGQYLLGFAAFKNHLSLFPTSKPIDVLKNKLTGFKITKGTIQFDLNNPLSESLIKELIELRLKQIISND